MTNLNGVSVSPSRFRAIFSCADALSVHDENSRTRVQVASTSAACPAARRLFGRLSPSFLPESCLFVSPVTLARSPPRAWRGPAMRSGAPVPGPGRSPPGLRWENHHVAPLVALASPTFVSSCTWENGGVTPALAPMAALMLAAWWSGPAYAIDIVAIEEHWELRGGRARRLEQRAAGVHGDVAHGRSGRATTSCSR